MFLRIIELGGCIGVCCIILIMVLFTAKLALIAAEEIQDKWNDLI